MRLVLFISFHRIDVDFVRSAKELRTFRKIVNKFPVVSINHVFKPSSSVVLGHNEDSLCCLVVLLCLLSMQDKGVRTRIRWIHEEMFAIQ